MNKITSVVVIAHVSPAWSGQENEPAKNDEGIIIGDVSMLTDIRVVQVERDMRTVRRMADILTCGCLGAWLVVAQGA